MRIAVAASLLKAISPESTGGTEAFAYILTEGLVEQGQDVTMFATSDSKTNAKLAAIVDSKQTTGVYEGTIETRTPYQLLQAANLVKRSGEFDIIHNNYFHYFLLTSLAPFTNLPIVTTMHNHFWQFPNLKRILVETQRKGKDMVVFASHAARKLADNLFDTEVIYHGIDISSFPYSPESDDYVLFFSRLVPYKGIKDAIDTARTGGFRLNVAGGQPVIPEHIEYVKEHVNPYFSDTILYKGAPSEVERLSLYQRAKVLLFPTQLEEQFGLVAAEAMACGTPVIAYNNGALSEVVEDGVTGFIIDPDDTDRPGKGSWVIQEQGVAGLVEAVKRIDEIDRAACRKRIEAHFTREIMINHYLALYQRMLQNT